MKQAANMRRFIPDEDLRAIAMAAPGTTQKHDAKQANIKIYTIPPSLCSQRVRMTALEKGLPYTEQTVDTANGKNLTPDYLALNPRGVVPTMTFDDRSIFDSATIMRFINNYFHGPDLAPETPDAWAKMNRWIDLSDDFPIRGFTYRSHLNSGLPDTWQIGMHDNIVRARELYPQHRDIYDRKLQDWFDLTQWVKNPGDTQEGEAMARSMADEAERVLSSQSYLVGTEISLADISVFVLFMRLQCACSVSLWGDGLRPNLHSWIERLKARPSYNGAVLEPYRKSGTMQISGDCWLPRSAA